MTLTPINLSIAIRELAKARTRHHRLHVWAVVLGVSCALTGIADAQQVTNDCDALRQELKEKAQPERQPNPEYVGFGGDCYNCYPFIDSPGKLDGHSAEDIDTMSCDELLALAQKIGNGANGKERQPNDAPAKDGTDQDAEAALERWLFAPRDHVGPWTVADDHEALDRLAKELGLQPPNSDYPEAPGDTPWDKAKQIGKLWASFIKDAAVGEVFTTILTSIVSGEFKVIVELADAADTAVDGSNVLGESVRIAMRHGPTPQQQAASNVKVRRERLDALGDRLYKESQRTGGINPVIEEAREGFWRFRRKYNI
jgi:hypothetical protein